MESNESTGELAVKLLWNQANALPQENHTNQLLRSNYLTICKKIAGNDVKLPAVKFAPSVMCPQCSSIWSESKFSLSLKPKKIHSHKAEKLVDRLKNDQKSLSRKQKKRAKWLKKKICNNVEIKCEFCQKKTQQTLLKPKIKPTIEEKVPEIEIVIKKKKKKKSKDKSAGLKLNKVIPSEKKLNPPSKKANKPKAQPTKPKKKAEMTISKTQKQNSLLQLAKMLKNQSPGGCNKPSNQLENLLR